MFDPIGYFERTKKQIERGIVYNPFKKSLSFFVSRKKSNTSLNINIPFDCNIKRTTSSSNVPSIATIYYPFGANTKDAINTIKLTDKNLDIILLVNNKLVYEKLNLIGSIPKKLHLFFYLNSEFFKPIGIVRQFRFYNKPKILPQVQVEFFLKSESIYESSIWLNRFDELTDD